ncbi:hypothetical protein [Actinacidiphila bryophytorum]|uniref:hypothetical protein n=1 Tax=Actinacidiphila bryophytorum TaxID=1436133 RepID=UPI002176E5BD|nr:hypothetical protein [Actinacidiphila bryophytorum]UWE11786.1 hypothetical protein NYE86_25845 [Actinacidiphila bryophytorum]
MAESKVVGRRPLVFTDAHGAQGFVPLQALVLGDGGLELDATWRASFSETDRRALLALARDAWSSGELAAPPVAPKSPAIVFTAACAGPESNGITVAVTNVKDPEPDPALPLHAGLTLTVSEKDEYVGLSSAADAVARIGVDKPAADGKNRAGSGLVQIKEGSAAAGDGLPKGGAAFTVTAAAPVKVKAADGTTDYFTLVVREGLPDPGVKVTVTVDAEAKKYSLTAEYTSGEVPTTLGSLGALAASAASIVTAEAPPGGYAMPADTLTAPVALSGGATGIAATGTAYTS